MATFDCVFFTTVMKTSSKMHMITQLILAFIEPMSTFIITITSRIYLLLSEIILAPVLLANATNHPITSRMRPYSQSIVLSFHSRPTRWIWSSNFRTPYRMERSMILLWQLPINSPRWQHLSLAMRITPPRIRPKPSSHIITADGACLNASSPIERKSSCLNFGNLSFKSYGQTSSSWPPTTLNPMVSQNT